LGSNHNGSLSIARSLGRLGVKVFVHEPKINAPVFYSKYCKGKYVWRDDKTSPSKTIKHLLEVAKKIGERSILVPYSDENANIIAKYADDLRDHFIFPQISSKVIQSVSNKKEMHFLAKKYNIPTPEAHFPQSRSDVETYTANANFPLMLKTICSHSRVSGGQNYLAKTKEQLFNLYDQNENSSSPNFFIQEHISGPVESSWMFNGYFNHQSECLFAMTGKKVLQSPPEAGVTSIGVIEKNNEIIEISKRFMTGLGYRGMVDIDYRFDKCDGKYKILDVNPRIGLTFRLFAGDNGLDVIRTAYLDLTGQKIPASQSVNGRKYLVEDSYIFNVAKQYLSGQFTNLPTVKSLAGLKETAYFAFDDPNPFIIRFLQTTSATLKQL
jgi:D-aspartate ligase